MLGAKSARRQWFQLFSGLFLDQVFPVSNSTGLQASHNQNSFVLEHTFDSIFLGVIALRV